MKYNSPFMKILETAGNMIIVSFLWLVCSVPVLTIIPATAALYHTTAKVINGTGQGVIKDYFNAFKLNFVLGLKVNVICLIVAFFTVIGINTGLQIYTLNAFGMFYLILGFVIAFTAAVMLVHLPAVISRFYIGVLDSIRLSIFFGIQNIFMSVVNVALLAFFVLVVETIPITIMIVPALYIDLIRPITEKKMNKFISDYQLQEAVIDTEKEEEKEDVASGSDINDSLARKRKKK